MTSNDHDDDELRRQIAEEERLVRIYEAKLALLVKEKNKRANAIAASDPRKRAREPYSTPFDTEQNQNDDGDIEWLETLDALQSNGPSFHAADSMGSAVTNGDNNKETIAVPLKTTWHDDNTMYRLLPMVGGVSFSSARALPANQKDENFLNKQRRPYELKGRVSSPNATEIEFIVFLTIEITENLAESNGNKRKKKHMHPTQEHHRASIVSLQLQFNNDPTTAVENESVSSAMHGNKISKGEELNQLSIVARETRSLPHVLRQLVCWAEFDAQRCHLLETLVGEKQKHRSNNDESSDEGGCGDSMNSKLNSEKLSIHRIQAHEFEICIFGNDDDLDTKPFAKITKDASRDMDSRSNHDVDRDHDTKEPPPSKVRLSLRFSWKWNCVWYGKADEELKLIGCYISSNAKIRQAPDFDKWIREIQDPQGLKDLLLCCNGSCAGAIRILVATLLSAIQ